MKTTIPKASELIIPVFKAGLMPMLHGSPGIGKSEVVHQIAKKFNLKLIDMRLSMCDPTDLLGFPRINGDRSGYVPLEDFPLEGDPIPDGYSGWLLFLDELTSAPSAVQPPAYKLILDRMVGNRRLHSKVAIAGAGNLESDGAIVTPMSTALQSRMIHFEVELCVDGWLTWAMENNIHHMITSYIQFKRDHLYTFKPDHTDKTYASPRTWEFTNKLMMVHQDINRDFLYMAAGALGEGVARDFYTFCELKDRLPSMQSIIRAPLTTEVPGEPGIQFAISGAIAAYAEPDNCEPLMAYVKRMPAEFQVRTLRTMVKRNKALLTVPSVLEWLAVSAADML